MRYFRAGNENTSMKHTAPRQTSRQSPGPAGRCGDRGRTWRQSGVGRFSLAMPVPREAQRLSPKCAAERLPAPKAVRGDKAKQTDAGDQEEGSWLDKAKKRFELFSSGNARRVEECWETVAAINALEPYMVVKTDDQLAAMTDELRARLRAGEQLGRVLPAAYATVREVSRRLLGMRHFDVQLLGGTLLNDGCVAQMNTGEGKTLVATLPAYLNALDGKGVYVVTVNDFLAERDASEMGAIYKFLGLTCQAVTADAPHQETRRAFESVDVVYLTARTLGFSYLQHISALRPQDEVFTRALSFCIVDEVDSILLDESNQPLIFASPVDDAAVRSRLSLSNMVVGNLTGCRYYYKSGEPIPVQMQERFGGDFTTDVTRGQKTVEFTDQGQAKVVAMLVAMGALPPGATADALWDSDDPDGPWGPLILKSLEAHNVWTREEHYTVIDGHVVLVDANTGRPSFKTRWQDGLHQAVEAKEGVEIRSENRMVAKITFQMFFRLFRKLSGMTGTAEAAAFEMYLLYKLPVAVVPPNRPMARIDHPLELYWSQDDKFQKLLYRIGLSWKKGRPVLIGTESIEESDAVAAFLRKVAPFLKFQVLNARPEFLRQESEIIAQAGLPQAVTVSTNMAGRGTDIKLGGDPRGLAKAALARSLLPELVQEAARHVEELPQFSIPINFDSPDGTVMGPEAEGLLFRAKVVAKTQAGSSLSMDQFDSFVDLAMEHIDALVSQARREGFLEGEGALAYLAAIGNAVNGDQILKAAVVAGLGLFSFFQTYCDRLGEQVKEAGGLLVIGAAFMPSERVAMQLRGRAGRQGDPGESVLMGSFMDIFTPTTLKTSLGGPMGEMVRTIFSAESELGLAFIPGDWIESTGIDLYESDQALMLARNSLKEQDEVFQEFSNDFHRLRRQLLIGTHDEVLNILSRYFQDFVDDLVSERINPAKPPMSWPCDEVLSELWEVVNGPKLAPGQSAPSLQLDYMGQQQRMALLDALRSNGPVPSHRSSFPITLHMKVALKRYRQGCKERKSQRLAVHGRFARAVESFRDYLGETLVMAFFEHEQATALLWRIPKGSITEIRRGHLLRVLDDMYAEFLARSVELQSGVSLKDPQGGVQAYRDVLRKDTTTVLEQFRRACVRDVFRIQYYRTSTLTLGPEALLDYEESRKASNNRPGTGLPPGNDAEIVPETVGASSRPEV